jgi:hypothetical protein
VVAWSSCPLITLKLQITSLFVSEVLIISTAIRQKATISHEAAEVTLQLTVGQSVRLSIEPTVELANRY